jgi:subtilase family serine protease
VLIPVSSGYQSKSFFVDIKVVSPTPTPTNTPEPKADLIINLLELTPATPTNGNAVAVKVQVYNQGNATAGAFKVAWWPGENYASPACEWDVPSLVAMGGLVLNCNYAGYPSPYASIVTKASADTGNAISESNESNNDAKMTISVQ